MHLYVTLDLISPPAQEKFETCKSIFLIFQSTQHNWCHMKAAQQGIHFFSYLKVFLLSSLFLGLAPGSRCQEPHGASVVSEGCCDPRLALSAGAAGWLFLQLNQGRTFLLLPKDSPPLGSFSQARLAGNIKKQSQRAVKLRP